jgi:GT2 family glycosyltransferase
MTKLIYPVAGLYRDEPVDVSVIIPLYKSFAVIQEQIQRWVTDEDLKVEIIYVDDKCPQKSKRAVFKSWNKRRDHKKHLIKLVLSETNRGFGGACNLGADYARGKYLVFLNADTIVTPNWVAPMVELLQREDVGLVGNLQIKDGGEWHGSIDGAGSEWSWEHMNFFHIGRHIYQGKLLEEPYYPHNAPQDILEVGEREMLTGCCFAIRSDLFREIGGFNYHYRIGYWEDSEICMTLREMGYKVMFQPESIIYHKLHHSGAGQHPFAEANRNYFHNKWIATQRIDKFVKAKRNVKPVKVSNILVQREAAHGDVLVAAAVLPAIRKQYPSAKIYFATICPEALKGNPYLDHVINIAEKHQHIYQLRYNLDLAYERRPYTNILQAYADEVGVSIEDCKLFIEKEFDICYL